MTAVCPNRFSHFVDFALLKFVVSYFRYEHLSSQTRFSLCYMRVCVSDGRPWGDIGDKTFDDYLQMSEKITSSAQLPGS